MSKLTVALTAAPTIDKVVAFLFCLIGLRRQGRKIDRVVFQDAHGQVPPDALDIDVRCKYGEKNDEVDKTGVGSGTEWEAQRWGLLDLPGVPELVEMMNTQNKTGELKMFPFSFAALCREVWVLGKLRPTEFDALLRAAGLEVETVQPYDPVEMLYRLVKIPAAYLAIKEKKEEELGDSEAARKWVNEKFSHLQVAAKHPLGLAGYLISLRRLGRSEAEIIAEADYWQAVFTAVRDNDANDDEAVMAIQEGVELSGKWRGVYVETNNRRVIPKVFEKNPDIAIIVVRDVIGHVAVLVRKDQVTVDLTGLAEVLNTLEPGLWYHGENYKTPWLADGGESRTAPPTGLVVSHIVGLLKNKRLVQIKTVEPNKLDTANKKKEVVAKTSPPYVEDDIVEGTVSWWDKDQSRGHILIGGVDKAVRVERAALNSKVTYLIAGRKVQIVIGFDRNYNGWYAKRLRLVFDDKPAPTPASATPPAASQEVRPAPAPADEIDSKAPIAPLVPPVETAPATPLPAAPEPVASPAAPTPPTVTVQGKVVSWSVATKFGFVEARGRRIRVEAADLTRLVGRRTSVLLVGREIEVDIDSATADLKALRYIQ